jgi:mRNA interferase RelE/StbE
LADILFFVKTDRKAGKSYQKMPEFYRRRIFELGQVLKVKPVPAQEYDVSKLAGVDDTYRIRIGDIRIYTKSCGVHRR